MSLAVRRECRQEEPDPLTEAMSRILADLDADRDAAGQAAEPAGLVPLRYPTPEERSLG